ncbi:MAG: hypothetical protein K2X03_15260 [Bryobacteraceae bacterium]|nr:hypothetical protein [Bryobacteraceae bacterium]
MRTIAFWLGLALALQADEKVAGWESAPSATGLYGDQEIRFRVVGGQAVAEGDMILGSVSEAKTRAGLIALNPSTRWPENRIPYVIDPGLSNAARVTTAISTWEQLTPFRFVVRTTETSFVRFRRDPSGCNANLGRTGAEQFVNLADACSTGNTIHEIGHALGLSHEQGRRDRFAYISMNYPNIDKRYWDQYDAQLRSFDQGPYDYASIMHYSRTGFNRNAQPAFESVPPGIPVGQRATLSMGDVLAGYRIADTPYPGFIVDSIPSGLPLMVDGESVTTPRIYGNWQPGQEHTIEAPEVNGATALTRYQYVRWAHGGDRQQRVTLTDGGRLLVVHYAQDVLVRVGAGTGGTARLEPPSPDGFYRMGTPIRVVAEAAEGFSYLSWTAGVGGAIDSAGNGIGQALNPSPLLVLREGLFYQANFSRNPVTTVATDPPGVPITVNNVSGLGPRGFTFAAGAMQTITTAETILQGNDTVRYRFTGWTRNGEPVEGRALSFAGPTANTLFVAKFTPEHLVTFNTDWVIVAGTPRPSVDNIEINPRGPDGYYPAGTLLNFRATSADTFRFLNWSYDFSGLAAERQVEVNDQIYAVANFTSPVFLNARAIVGASSLQPNFGISPGELVWVHSAEVGPEEAVDAVPVEGVWPATLASVRVLFNGVPGAMVRAERSRVLVAAPFDLPDGLLPVVVEREGVRRGTPQLGSVVSNPALETRDGSGRGEAGRAAPGGVLELRFTGAGVTSPATPPGRAAAGPPAAAVVVRLGGRDFPATAVFPVPDRPNSFRLELRLPDDMPRGPQAVEVGVGARGSQTGVFVLISGE